MVAGAASGVTALKGDITMESVAGPTCTVTRRPCLSGTVSGKLKGTFGETVSTLTATADTPTTSVVFLTGDVLFTAEDGTLLFKEASALRTTGPR